jgi:dimethylargininase
MYQNCIVRTPSRSLEKGLTSLNLGKPNFETALKQHELYIEALKQCEVNVTILPPDERFPDSVFVEDPALCTPHCAILTRPGAESRRDETDIISKPLTQFFENIETISAPGTLDAGDVMKVDSHFYIGLSERTNAEGAQQLISILEKYGMTGSTISLKNVLHLKTGLAYLEHNNLLAAGEFVDKVEFRKMNVIEIPEEESYAANCIWMNDRVIMPAGYTRTREKIAALGYAVIEVDTSEFRKLDGGVSCLSLRF